MPEQTVETTAQEKQADPKIVDTLSIEDLKTTGAAGASAVALAIQNSVANQQRQQDNATSSAQRFNEIANQATGVLLKRIAEVDVIEAAATKNAGETSDLPSLLGSLNSAIAAIQQAVKGAITTPPTTG